MCPLNKVWEMSDNADVCDYGHVTWLLSGFRWFAECMALGKIEVSLKKFWFLKTVYEQVPVGLGLGQMESIERHWRRSISLEAKLSLVKNYNWSTWRRKTQPGVELHSSQPGGFHFSQAQYMAGKQVWKLKIFHFRNFLDFDPAGFMPLTWFGISCDSKT